MLNKVMLIGNLGADPEVRYMPSGEAVANLRLATTERYKDKSGAMQEATEWHKISFFGKTAETCGQYLKKGSQIYVEGSIKTRKYTDKEGVEKFVTEIRGDRMQMLGGRGAATASGSEAGPAPAPAARPAPAPANGGGFDDEIPFGPLPKWM